MKYHHKETISLALLLALDIFLGGRGTSKLIQKTLSKYFQEKSKKMPSNAVLQTTLSRLKKEKLIISDGRGWFRLTGQGKHFVSSYQHRNKSYQTFLQHHGSKRNTLIIFDVPEHKKGYRNLLRQELVELNFQLLQKSVWIGGSPLPKEFVEQLSFWGILPYIHIFTIHQKGTIH